MPLKILRKLEEPKVKQNSFDFLYPTNNSKFQSANCKDVAIKLKIKGRKAPFNWYIDGKLSENKDKKLTIYLNTGAHTISVIDTKGKHIST